MTSAWSWVWAVLVAVVVAVEVAALLDTRPGNTFSETLREWARGHWLRRAVVIVVLAWLARHWLGG